MGSISSTFVREGVIMLAFISFDSSWPDYSKDFFLHECKLFALVYFACISSRRLRFSFFCIMDIGSKSCSHIYNDLRL